jgi:hypothetical protein
MTRSRRLYLVRAAALIQRGTEFISDDVSRGEAVNQWETETMNVLLELDKGVQARMRASFSDVVKSKLIGKTDRIRALIGALDSVVAEAAARSREVKARAKPQAPVGPSRSGHRGDC